MLFVVISDR